jgi:hypothetical protein
VVVEEVRHTAVEHDDLDVGIGRELVDDLCETAASLADEGVTAAFAKVIFATCGEVRSGWCSSRSWFCSRGAIDVGMGRTSAIAGSTGG